MIHVNVGTGITTAHLASLIHDLNGTIFAFGIESENQHKECIRNLEKFGARGSLVVCPITQSLCVCTMFRKMHCIE